MDSACCRADLHKKYALRVFCESIKLSELRQTRFTTFPCEFIE